MDMLASIDRQIAELQKMRECIEAAQKAKFDAAQMALPIADEGWIEWKGGDRPVVAGVIVDTKWRNGTIYTDNAACFGWDHISEQYDIIAYRIAGERT